MSPQDVLRVEEISKILGISINTLQRRSWRMKTGCPLKKIGRRLLIYRKDFEDWFRGMSG